MKVIIDFDKFHEAIRLLQVIRDESSGIEGFGPGNSTIYKAAVKALQTMVPEEVTTH